MTGETVDPGFLDLLTQTRMAHPPAEMDPPHADAVDILRRYCPDASAETLLQDIESAVAEIDALLSAQLNAILHAPPFQAMEATWRGLDRLVQSADKDVGVKVKVLNINKRELNRTMRKFRGQAWDQSPIFLLVYEAEYGQLGGEPYGMLIGDYEFDHRPEDIALLSDVAMVAAAAHAPFIAAAAPSLLHMDSWAEVINPRDLRRITTTAEFNAWNSLRDQPDARYIGLCMPRFLARLPYGSATSPLDLFAFEEVTEHADTSRLLWANAAWAFATNLTRAFAEYGWCCRIRGIDRGGIVEGLPVLHHPTADGNVDRRTVTEICISERREAELASCGLIPLVHRKNADVAAFISAPSLQRPQVFEDPDATTNASLSARLPYLFVTCRFAHYLKSMVRNKVGSNMSRADLNYWLSEWLIGYVDGSPMTSSEEFKAAHPLSAGRVILEDIPDRPGQFEAKVYLTPQYQLERVSVALRLVSRLTTEGS